jgi:hypothetical protein
MKSKILTLLLGLAIISYAPLLAQVPEEPMPEEQPVAEETAAPTAAETEEIEMQAEEEGTEEELPATASPLPLLALLGSASVASAAWLRLRHKK